MLSLPPRTTSARNICTLFATLQTADFFMICLKQFHVRIMSQAASVLKEIYVIIYTKLQMILSSQNQALFFVNNSNQQAIVLKAISVFTSTQKSYAKISAMVSALKERSARIFISKPFLVETIY